MIVSFWLLSMLFFGLSDLIETKSHKTQVENKESQRNEIEQKIANLLNISRPKTLIDKIAIDCNVKNPKIKNKDIQSTPNNINKIETKSNAKVDLPNLNPKLDSLNQLAINSKPTIGTSKKDLSANNINTFIKNKNGLSIVTNSPRNPIAGNLNLKQDNVQNNGNNLKDVLSQLIYELNNKDSPRVDIDSSKDKYKKDTNFHPAGAAKPVPGKYEALSRG